MSGRLGEWSIEDLLQIARITHKTTSIEVRSDQLTGAVFLRDGSIVDAVIDGEPPLPGSRFSQVVEVIEAMAAIEDGTFEFGTRQLPVVDDRPIEVSAITTAMEKDGMREKRLAELGIDPGERVALDRHIEDAITLKPAVWQLLADLVDVFSLSTLAQRMGRRKAVATLLTLDALGVLARDLPIDPPAVERHASPPAVNPEPDRTPLKTPAGEPEGEPAQPAESPVPSPPVDADVPSTGESAVQADVAADATHPESDDVELFVPDLAFDPGEVSSPHADTEDAEAPYVRADDEPVVEIFEASVAPQASGEMHEVVTPSETTLVSDVLSDMRSRFRTQRYEEIEAASVEGHDPEDEEAEAES